MLLLNRRPSGRDRPQRGPPRRAIVEQQQRRSSNEEQYGVAIYPLGLAVSRSALVSTADDAARPGSRPPAGRRSTRRSTTPRTRIAADLTRLARCATRRWHAARRRGRRARSRSRCAVGHPQRAAVDLQRRRGRPLRQPRGDDGRTAGTLAARPTGATRRPSPTCSLILYQICLGGGRRRSRARRAVWVLARVASAVLGDALGRAARARRREALRPPRRPARRGACSRSRSCRSSTRSSRSTTSPALVGVCLSLWGSAGVAARRARRATTRSPASGSGSPRRRSTPAASSRSRCSAAALARPAAAGATARRWPRSPASSRSPPSSRSTRTRSPTGTAFTQRRSRTSPRESCAGTGKLGLTHGSGIVYYLWSLTWGVGWAPSLAALGGAVALARARPAGVRRCSSRRSSRTSSSWASQGRYFGRWLMPIDPDRLPARRLRRDRAPPTRSRAAPRAARRRCSPSAAGLCAQGAIDSSPFRDRQRARRHARAALAWLDRARPARTRGSSSSRSRRRRWCAALRRLPDLRRTRRRRTAARAASPAQPGLARGLRADAVAGADRALRARRLLLGRHRLDRGGPRARRPGRRAGRRSPTTARSPRRATRVFTASPVRPGRSRSRSTSTGPSTTTRAPTRGPGRWSSSTSCRRCAAPASGRCGRCRTRWRASGGTRAVCFVCDATCSETDLAHLERASSSPRNGSGRVNPNPVVGAVIAVGGRVLGEGWHEELGGAHAEVNAIADCGGADLRERDALRDARAVLPLRPHAAVHRRDPRRRHPARRRRQRRPDREGLRPRPRDPARRGRRDRGRRRRARARARGCSTRASASTPAPGGRGSCSSRR